MESLQRYRRLLARYLRPHWPHMLMLAAILFGAIAAQVAAPLVASRFIDQAVAGAPLSLLVRLALLATGLALAGQGLGVIETWLAENV
ncbi:MAG TPA: hypothetical protein VFI22_13885, partial [Thermomicrobiales bacterium]|nr:hypothetical protein [Thermomicrobiales bacterium]